MEKKAEVTSQMFMYIAAAIIAAVILIIGFNAIMKLTATQQQANDQLFKKSLASYFDTVDSLSYGSERVNEFNSLPDFKTICFISRDMIKAGVLPNPTTGYAEIDKAIAASSRNNVYLISFKTTESLEVSDISDFLPLTQNHFYCANITTAKISIKLKAMGDSVEVVDVE